MNMIDLFGWLTLFFILCNIATQITMAAYLKKRGYKVNVWLIRLYILKYIMQYRAATIEEYGKTGLLFFYFISSLVLLVACLIVFLVLLSA